MASARVLSAVLSTSSDKIDLLPYGKELNEATKKMLNTLEKEKVPNKKLLWFFENNFEKIALKLDKTPHQLRGKDFWNHLIYRYFVNSPGLLKSNPKVVFNNLELSRPQLLENKFKN